MKFLLPDLPYNENALSPFISQQTLAFHHKKHHSGYIDKLNAAIEGRSEYKNKDLVDVIKYSNLNKSDEGIFNNAAQSWNHDFYWKSMKQDGGGLPSKELLDKIVSSFGSYDAFVAEFKQASVSQFGSGWAWLVLDTKQDKLSIHKTSNAQSPLTMPGYIPLLTVDVWEHAYYLDYQNRRPDYVSSFCESLVDWNFALENMRGAASLKQ